MAGPPTGTGGAWLLHGHAILRSTGFPWQLLEAVREESTSRAADEAAAARAAAERTAADTIGALREVKDLPAPARNRLRKTLGKRTDPGELDGLPESAAAVVARYRRALGVREDAVRAYREAYEAGFRETARSLARLTEDPRFAEAIWLSSPPVLERGVPEIRRAQETPSSGRARAARRQFAGYLQRLCAKNETTSFFGPIDYTDFADPATDPVWRTDRLKARHAFVSHPAVTTLAGALASDSRIWPMLRPRLRDLARIQGGTVRLAGRRLSVTSADVTLLTHCDGTRRVADIAVAMGMSFEETMTALRALSQQGVLSLDCRPPVTCDDPLSWLWHQVADAGEVGDGPDEWRAVLDRMDGLRREFETSPLARRRELLAEAAAMLAAVTGTEPDQSAPPRGGGRWYADRQPIAEECVGSLTPLHLGRRAQEAIIAGLTPALNLLAGEAVARHRALTEAVLVAEPALAAGAEVPLLRLLGREIASPLETAATAATPGREYVERLLAAAGDCGEVRIAPAELPDADLGEDPLIGSPDIMFDTSDSAAVRDGRAEMVLAECHDTMLLWGWAVRFHTDSPAVETAGAALLRAASGDRHIASVLGGRRAKIAPFVFPGPLVTAGGTTDSRWPTTRTSLAEIRVRFDGRRLVCRSPVSGEFVLHNGELDSPIHNALALPRIRPVRFGSGDRLPRLYIGNVLVQRACWSVPLPPLGDDPGTGYDKFRERCLRAGVARYSYARPSGERKPVLVDLEAPALIDLLRHLAGQAPTVTLTEAWPRPPDGLWLRGSTGRHCAELRTTVVLDRSR
jgi:hypothetical protein